MSLLDEFRPDWDRTAERFVGTFHPGNVDFVRWMAEGYRDTVEYALRRADMHLMVCGQEYGAIPAMIGDRAVHHFDVPADADLLDPELTHQILRVMHYDYSVVLHMTPRSGRIVEVPDLDAVEAFVGVMADCAIGTRWWAQAMGCGTDAQGLSVQDHLDIAAWCDDVGRRLHVLAYQTDPPAPLPEELIREM